MLTREQALRILTGPDAQFEIVDAQVLGYRLPVYKNAVANLREVLIASRLHGDREFLVYEQERLTFAEHFNQVARLATLLLTDGVRHGDRVAIGMRNYPEWVVAFWACQAIGAVAVTLNAWWTTEELAYAFNDSSSVAALIDAERWQRIHALDLPVLEHIYITRPDGAPLGRAKSLATALAALPGQCELPIASIAPDDDATMLYTSGTTGFPKGAVGTHRNHVTNITNSLLAGALAQEIAGLTVKGVPVAAPTAPAPQAVSLQTFPFFHIGGLSGLYLSTALGTKLVLMYRWDAATAAELIEREGVNSLAGVPTVVRQLLESAAKHGRSLASLVSIASGGAPVPPDLINRIGNQFASRVMPGNGYGLTETTSAVVTNGGQDYFAHPDSVGRPVPVAAVRVVDDNGVDVAEGAVGELWVCGPNVVRGYWNKPEATAEAFTNGWFHTGDLGYRSSEGFYYVVDRKKDVVIRGGENVYCAEVEAVLFTHPAVQDVAIIGLPSVMLGEEVAAVVQLRHGETVGDVDLQNHVAIHLARFKVPTKFFYLDEALPRTATGKVLKRDLKLRFG